MHSLGIYRTGCEFGSKCKHTHERPSVEPPENTLDAPDSVKHVASMARGAVPTNGGQQVQTERTADQRCQGQGILPGSKRNVMVDQQ